MATYSCKPLNEANKFNKFLQISEQIELLNVKFVTLISTNSGFLVRPGGAQSGGSAFQTCLNSGTLHLYVIFVITRPGFRSSGALCRDVVVYN